MWVYMGMCCKWNECGRSTPERMQFLVACLFIFYMVYECYIIYYDGLYHTDRGRISDF